MVTRYIDCRPSRARVGFEFELAIAASGVALLCLAQVDDHEEVVLRRRALIELRVDLRKRPG